VIDWKRRGNPERTYRLVAASEVKTIKNIK